MLGHEGVEVVLGVLAARVGVEHRVEVGEHLLDPRHRLGVVRRLLQRVAHPLELRVEHLALQQLADLLVGLRRGRVAPRVRREVADLRGGLLRQRGELGLGQPGVVGGVVLQRGPLGVEGLSQQPAHLLKRAVEPAGPAQLALPAPRQGAQVVQPPPALGAAPQHRPQRLERRGAGQHVLAEGVDGRGHVGRRAERVRAAVVAAVAVAARHGRVSPPCSGLGPRRRPCRSGGSATAPQGRTPGPRRRTPGPRRTAPGRARP